VIILFTQLFIDFLTIDYVLNLLFTYISCASENRIYGICCLKIQQLTIHRNENQPSNYFEESICSIQISPKSFSFIPEVLQEQHNKLLPVKFILIDLLHQKLRTVYKAEKTFLLQWLLQFWEIFYGILSSTE
jgi:hypothetical protein